MANEEIKIDFVYSGPGISPGRTTFIVAPKCWSVSSLIQDQIERLPGRFPHLNFTVDHDVNYSFQGKSLSIKDNRTVGDIGYDGMEPIKVEIVKKELIQSVEKDENMRIKLSPQHEGFCLTIADPRLAKVFQTYAHLFLMTNAFSKVLFMDKNGDMQEGDGKNAEGIIRYEFYFNSSSVSQEDQLTLMEGLIAVVKNYRSTLHMMSCKSVLEPERENILSYFIKEDANLNKLSQEVLDWVKDFCQKKNILPSESENDTNSVVRYFQKLKF